MANYRDAISEHARIALRLYKPRLGELEKLSGLRFSDDGSCLAATAPDVTRYLDAIKAIGGQVSYISAKMVIANALRKLGLPPVG
jgi:hypothetical protein